MNVEKNAMRHGIEPRLSPAGCPRSAPIQQLGPRHGRRGPLGFHLLPRRIDRSEDGVVMVVKVGQCRVDLGRRQIGMLAE